MRPDVAAILAIADALDYLGVEWHIGGSVASSAHGLYRSTSDIDIVANLKSPHVAPLVSMLESAFYVDAQMIREAIANRSSFNMIHLDTIYKVDIFLPRLRPFDLSVWKRTVRLQAFRDLDRDFSLASAEDTMLSKLEWYRQGGEISQRQWEDILNIAKIQSDGLDQSYLHTWAAELGVADLLERVLREADAP